LVLGSCESGSPSYLRASRAPALQGLVGAPTRILWRMLWLALRGWVHRLKPMLRDAIFQRV
jgi:hypothetical protein